jgi:hypothetical protein
MPELFLVFKKYPQTNVENFVSWCAGPMVHVDIVLGDSRVMFTSYMFERFSMNTAVGYTPDTHETLAVRVSPEEYSKVEHLLLDFVQRGIPYNYSDVFHLILPSLTTVQDVESSADVDTLFCSQAVTLALRLGLDEQHPLRGPLRALNSRCTTPTMLYDAVKPHCKPSDLLVCHT